MQARHGPRRASLARAAPVAGAVIVVLLLVVPSWPGRVHNDTLAMLRQVERGDINDWHSPLLQLLWLPFDRLGLGIGWVLLGQTLVFYASAWWLARHLFRSALAATAAAVALCLNPVTYGLLSAVIRDTWFLVFWTASLALLVVPSLQHRTRLLAVSAAALLAYAARQNGLAIMPIVLFPVLPMVRRGASSRRAWSASFRPVIAVTVALVAVVVIEGVQDAAGVEDLHGEAATMTTDLLRMSLRQGELLIPDAANPDGVTIEEMQRLASPTEAHVLIERERLFAYILPTDEYVATRSAWIREIRSDPLEYLRMRWQLFSTQIGLGARARGPFLPASIPNDLGIEPAFPRLAAAATDYQLWFTGGPDWWVSGDVHRAWPWLLVTGAAAIVAARRRRGSPIVVVAAASSAAYALSTFVLAPVQSVRFAAPNIVIASVCGLALLVPWRPLPFEPWAPAPADRTRHPRSHATSDAPSRPDGDVVTPEDSGPFGARDPATGDGRTAGSRTSSGGSDP